MRAIIVDDEAKGRRSLQIMLQEYCKDVEVVQSVNNVGAAKEVILELKPDVVFLDIELPGASGLTLLDMFDEDDIDVDFEVVFTTAYEKYALAAFRSKAVHYLLKPIEIDELIEAIDRVKRRMGVSNDVEEVEEWKDVAIQGDRRIALPANEGLIIINYDEIMYLKADARRTQFYLSDKTNYSINKTLKDFEDLLNTLPFIRVHRSFMVNLNYTAKLYRGRDRYLEMEDGASIDISKNKRKEVMDALENYIK